jgi:hypothetical protein
MAETNKLADMTVCKVASEVETESLLVLLRGLHIQVHEDATWEVSAVARLTKILTVLLEGNAYLKADWGNSEVRQYIDYIREEVSELDDLFARMWRIWTAKIKSGAVSETTEKQDENER